MKKGGTSITNLSILVMIALLSSHSPANGQNRNSGQKGGLFKKIFGTNNDRKPASRSTQPATTRSTSTPKPKPKPSKPKYSSLDSLPSAPERIEGKQRILVLTDSQGFTEFGPNMLKILNDAGYQVIMHAVKNGGAYFWTGMWKSPVLTRIYEPSGGKYRHVSMRPRTIDEYVAKYDPDIFIIQGGTNIDGDLIKGDSVDRLVTRCARNAAAKKALVLWIGMPDAQDNVKSPSFQKQASEQLGAALSEISEAQGFNSYFDSLASSLMPNSPKIGDGEHPGPIVASGWAAEAGKWVLANIKGFSRTSGSSRALMTDSGATREETDGDINPTASSYDALMTDFVAEDHPSVQLRLVAKSGHAKAEEMSYTDSFSVYKYEVLNATEVIEEFPEYRFVKSVEEPGKHFAYLKHWTFHRNDEKESPLTPLAALESGTTLSVRLLPEEDHPLHSVLGTMNVVNDFDDYEARIFVSTNLLKERSELPMKGDEMPSPTVIAEAGTSIEKEPSSSSKTMAGSYGTHMAGFDMEDHPAVQLRLVEKSRHADPAEMSYTDSFSVYKYEVLNSSIPFEEFPEYSFALVDGEPEKRYVYLMHWTFHRGDHRTDALTPMATLAEGTIIDVILLPEEDHPLNAVLGTMNVVNDFDDYETRIFVSTGLLQERAALPGEEIDPGTQSTMNEALATILEDTSVEEKELSMATPEVLGSGQATSREEIVASYDALLAEYSSGSPPSVPELAIGDLELIGSFLKNGEADQGEALEAWNRVLARLRRAGGEAVRLAEMERRLEKVEVERAEAQLD